MKRLCLILLVCLLALTTQAQELTIKSMTVAGNDISASQYERKDLNGQACALVKVLLASPGAVFEGNVIGDVAYKTGEYWVYMTEGSKELRIKHPQTQPLQVVFKKLGIDKLASKTTYMLSVLLPQVAVQAQTQKLIIKYSPSYATVLIDTKLYQGDGRVEVELPLGSHDYIIAADGYESVEATVKLTAKAPRTVTEELEPTDDNYQNPNNDNASIGDLLKRKLLTLEDSMTYAIGYAQTAGLKDYLSEKLNVDTTLMKEFENGLFFGSGIGSGTYPAYKGEQLKSFNAGIQIGSQIVNQMIGGINKEVYGEDSTRSVPLRCFMAGFIAALDDNTTILNQSEATEVAQSLMAKVRDMALEDKYGQNRKDGERFLEQNRRKSGVHVTKSGLQYKIIKEGTGAIPGLDTEVVVHYEGRLLDGTVFDSSYKRGEPVSLKANQVIKGWEEALIRMPVGSVWELYIPQELAYGYREAGDIKPYSLLIFKVELIKINRK